MDFLFKNPKGFPTSAALLWELCSTQAKKCLTVMDKALLKGTQVRKHTMSKTLQCNQARATRYISVFLKKKKIQFRQKEANKKPIEFRTLSLLSFQHAMLMCQFMPGSCTLALTRLFYHRKKFRAKH